MARNTKKNELAFRHHLVLNQWLFSLFGLDSVSGFFEVEQGVQKATLEAFRDRFQLHGETAGRNADGEHLIVQRLRENITDEVRLSDEELLEYDRRIQAHTEAINAGRRAKGLEPVEWKYFQYLMLLFTEIYLDYLFTKPEELVAGLNQQIARWNARWIEEEKHKHKALLPIESGDDLWPQLNLVAYWSATGSGKTLVMHANILQYRFYQQRYGSSNDYQHHGKTKQLNKVILLTPNEDLTRQHLIELEASGIQASEFSHNAGDLFANDVVVIDINKFRDESKKGTVAVDAFGDNNLLLVDEGHRGTAGGSGGVWYSYRRQLAAKGFTFEYSATFAQSAISDTVNKDMGTSLRQSYTKAILFDYSYRHFYADGYGKQSQVLNIEKGVEQNLILYQMASLLSFYQQMHLYQNQTQQLAPFNLEKPLWVFVSSRVATSLTTKEGKIEANDMVQVLSFIDQVLSSRSKAIAAIRTLLNEGLVAQGGVNYLYGRFDYLKQLKENPENLYADMLERVFHSSGGRLYLENITGVQGEIALRAGEAGTPFGVINIGEPAKLLSLCEDHDLLVQDARFGTSLFNGINKPDSRVNLLLGSRKFTEGWSSWRVSNMTLMNVGRGEGAQIIQLFGRGVRLKGWNTTLKRSADIAAELKQHGVERPKHIAVLETLNIFGLNADYIDQFRKQLEDEDIPVNEGIAEVSLPLKPMANLPQDLSIIRVKDKVANRAIGGAGTAFLELAEQVVLLPPKRLSDAGRDYFCNPARVIVDFYPRIGGFATDGQTSTLQGNTQRLTAAHLALLDNEKLYFELLAFKRSKRWSNLTLSPKVINELLSDSGWYELQAPPAMMALGNLNNLSLWHDMAISLLRKYCEMFYNYRRKQWESDKLEFKYITDDSSYLPNVREDMPNGGYLVTLDPVRHESVYKELQAIKEQIAKDDVKQWQDTIVDAGLQFLFNERHFYQPLLTLVAKNVDYQVTPVPLNKGEAAFVADVQQAWNNGVFPDGSDVYLLRNIAGKGAVGVFIDGGFEPDFILWIKHQDEQGKAQQQVVFIDPKGLRQHQATDPKINFYRSIKELERTLHANHPDGQHIKLHSFLVSQTRVAVLESRWPGETQDSMEAKHILFPDDDEQYMEKLVQKLFA